MGRKATGYAKTRAERRGGVGFESGLVRPAKLSDSLPSLVVRDLVWAELWETV